MKIRDIKREYITVIYKEKINNRTSKEEELTDYKMQEK